jgi:hypothetical protein
MSLLLALVLAVQDPVPASAARSCPQGEVTHVFIDNHSIFDPEALPDDARIRWAYELANRIHMRTRPQFIERELLLSDGDCYEPALARESARILREFRFIADADVFGVPQPDGSTHLLVDTRDEWTTKLALGLRFDEGVRFEGASITEENFLGRGASVGLFFLDRDERREFGAQVEVPRLGRTRWDVSTAAATTRIGERLRQAAILPFQGEQVGTALRQEILHRRDYFNFVLPGEPGSGPRGDLSHVVVPLTEQRFQLGMVRRTRHLDDALLLGGGVSYERIDPGAPGSALGVVGGDFRELVPLDSTVAELLTPQLGARRGYRLNLSAGLRQIRFQDLRGLDAVAGVQDLPLGREAILTVGRSVGSTGPDRPPDVLIRTSLFRGGELGPLLSFVTLAGESRRELGRGWEGWRDTLAELQTFHYWFPQGVGSPTVVLRAAAQAGWHTDAPFQLTLGGPEGVRGYSETELPGSRRAVITVEGRWVLPNPLPEFADLGMTIFGDAGRMWAGDSPFGQDTGWRTTVGAGLRVGFPPGSASVIRFDIAVPTDPGVSRSPIVRISAMEWIGLLHDPRNQQLLRSRRSGLSADYSGVVRDRRPPG